MEIENSLTEMKAILEAGKTNRVEKLKDEFSGLLGARPNTEITADSDINQLRKLQTNVKVIIKS